MHGAERAIVAAALLLGGCGGDAPRQAASPTPPPPVATSSPVPSPTAMATPGAVPDAVTATTNEPFYSAVVAGDAIRLSGVDLPERRLPIVAREAVPGGVRWRAGAVVVTVLDRACADDMSGAARPFTATLAIDGRTARGCAFPTPPQATPTVAEGTIPPPFLGRWDRDAAACAAPATSIEGVTVSPRELRFHESLGEVTAVAPSGDGVAITARYTGEGERWTTRQTLTIDGDRLTIAGAGPPIRRMRCTGG